MSTLATRFRAILKGIQAAISTVLSKDRHREPILAPIYHHLSRTAQRWENLVAHLRAGTLPAQRHRAPRPTRPQTAPRLPTGQLWLIRAVDHYEANAAPIQLQLFLATEECAKFLAEVPRAARILRPLTRALGISMPGEPPPGPQKPLCIPEPPPDPWNLLPLDQRIGIRVIRPAPYPPYFKKTR